MHHMAKSHTFLHEVFVFIYTSHIARTMLMLRGFCFFNLMFKFPNHPNLRFMHLSNNISWLTHKS